MRTPKAYGAFIRRLPIKRNSKDFLLRNWAIIIIFAIGLLLILWNKGYIGAGHTQSVQQVCGNTCSVGYNQNPYPDCKCMKVSSSGGGGSSDDETTNTQTHSYYCCYNMINAGDEIYDCHIDVCASGWARASSLGAYNSDTACSAVCDSIGQPAEPVEEGWSSGDLIAEGFFSHRLFAGNRISDKFSLDNYDVEGQSICISITDRDIAWNAANLPKPPNLVYLYIWPSIGSAFTFTNDNHVLDSKYTLPGSYGYTNGKPYEFEFWNDAIYTIDYRVSFQFKIC